MAGENPFAKFATQQPAYTPPPAQSDNPFVKFTKPVDTTPYSKDELLEAYRNLPRDDPRREQVKQQIIKLGAEPFERGIMSKEQAQVAGITEGASLGMSDEINAGIAGLTGGRISALGGKTYDEELKLQRQQAANAQKDDPGHFADGQVAGMIIQAAPTFGASIPETMLGRTAINVGGGALQNGLYSAASSDGDMNDRLAAGAEGAAWGAGLGALPGVAELGWKGGKALVKGAVKNVQKVTNPGAYVEKEVVDTIASDWNARSRLEARALARGKQPTERRFLDGQDVVDAEGAGQRTMVSDLGGDSLRRKLKAVDNASPEASELMRGNAALRQTDQGQRTTEVISDSFGDTLNPKTVRDELDIRARDEKGAAYAAAESHPNASHLWNPTLQGAISSNVGKEALKKAIAASRDEAIKDGHEIIEPIFEEGADGLMSWTGKFRRPTGELVDDIQGLGLGLRFWDHVKRGFDEVIESLPVTAKTEAARIRAIKNNMVASLDQAVPQYAKARGTAREFFGMEDAHEAGAAYFKNMNAYDTAEARHALQAMKPATRELFARGYAAELVNRITQMGDAENVNKLFKSAQSRMKMRDALGPAAADNLEAYTHREMVQGLLGQHLGANSTTIQQAIAMEGLKVTAATGAGTYATGDITTGLMAGLAMRGGYKFAQRKIIQRYAMAMAELVTSEDPATIARILSKVSKQSGYMDFSRAVSNGANGISGAAGRGAGPTVVNIPGGGLPGGAQRVDPRMPFAEGGMVEDDCLPFADGGRVPFAMGNLVKDAIEYTLEGVAKNAGRDAKELGHSFIGTKETAKRNMTSGWSYKSIPPTDAIPHSPLDMSRMKEGDILIPFYGDKAPAGHTVTEINGVPLVDGGGSLYGGPGYMQGASQKVDGEIWRSHGNVIKGLDSKTKSALAAAMAHGYEDPSVFGLYVNMGNKSGDFAHNADLLARMAPNAKIPPATVAKFDDAMQKRYATWPGLLNTEELLPYINHSGNGAGQVRKAMMKTADNGWFIDNGMPNPGAIRFAATEPELAGLPDYGASGWTIGQRATGAATSKGSVHHPFYSTGYLGEYAGGLKPGINHEKLFRDGANMADARRLKTGKRYQPQAFYKQNSARKDGFQLVDDDILELLSRNNR